MHIAGYGDDDGIGMPLEGIEGMWAMILMQQSSVMVAAATRVMPTYVGRKMDDQRRGARWMLGCVDALKTNAVDWRLYIQNKGMTRHRSKGSVRPKRLCYVFEK